MRVKTNLNAAGDAPMMTVMSREAIGLQNRYYSSLSYKDQQLMMICHFIYNQMYHNFTPFNFRWICYEIEVEII